MKSVLGILNVIVIFLAVLLESSCFDPTGFTKPTASPTASQSAQVPQSPIIEKVEVGDKCLSVFFKNNVAEKSIIKSYKIACYTSDIAEGTAVEYSITEVTKSPAVVQNLTNGKLYAVKVSCVNNIGSSDFSVLSNFVIPAPVPPAVSSVSALAIDLNTTVTFCSVDDSSIDYFEITPCIDDVEQTNLKFKVSKDLTKPVASDYSVSPPADKGLSAGITYSFVVRAHNHIGFSPVVTVSNTVTPDIVPQSPSINITGNDAIATETTASVQLSVTMPHNNGGTAVKSYLLAYKKTSDQFYIENVELSKNQSGIFNPIKGLQKNTSYDFKLKLVNKKGHGAYSNVKNCTTKASAPSAPKDLAATIVDVSTIKVNGTPTSDGGLTCQYTAYAYESSYTTPTKQVTSPSLPIVIPDLTTGTAYTIKIIAFNDIGSSDIVTLSKTVSPDEVPNAPGVTSAKPLQATVTSPTVEVSLTINPPAANKGTAVTAYRVSMKLDNENYQPDTDLVLVDGVGTIGGLKKGCKYTFKVSARNSMGNSAYSNEKSCTTTTSAPMSVTNLSTSIINASSVRVWFTPGDTGGLTNNYTIETYQGSTRIKSVNGSETDYTVIELTPGTYYTFMVSAKNSKGSSLIKNISETPDSAPWMPLFISAYVDRNEVSFRKGITIEVTPPMINNGSVITSYDVSCEGVFNSWYNNTITTKYIGRTPNGDNKYLIKCDAGFVENNRYNIKMRYNNTMKGDWSSTYFVWYTN